MLPDVTSTLLHYCYTNHLGSQKLTVDHLQTLCLWICGKRTQSSMIHMYISIYVYRYI